LLSLAGASASALTVGHAGNMPTSSTDPSHEITLSEEEVSDVTLATFYVFDKERPLWLRPACGWSGGAAVAAMAVGDVGAVVALVVAAGLAVAVSVAGVLVVAAAAAA
jgi:hypothetical protein